MMSRQEHFEFRHSGESRIPAFAGMTGILLACSGAWAQTWSGYAQAAQIFDAQNASAPLAPDEATLPVNQQVNPGVAAQQAPLAPLQEPSPEEIVKRVQEGGNQRVIVVEEKEKHIPWYERFIKTFEESLPKAIASAVGGLLAWFLVEVGKTLLAGQVAATWAARVIITPADPACAPPGET